MKIQMVKEAETADTKNLHNLRTAIIRAVSPLEASGSDLHDILMQHLKKVNKLS